MKVVLFKLTKPFKVSIPCFLCVFTLISFAHATELKRGEWYVRLIVEAPSENLKDTGNALGGLRSSSNGYDNHDLKELSPFGSPYLTIVFPHSDWGEHRGNYASDYHRARHWRIGDEWEFTVKSNIPREVKLSWKGHKGLNRIQIMKLINIESGEVVNAVRQQELQTYTFTMVSTSHRFKWIYPARPKP